MRRCLPATSARTGGNDARAALSSRPRRQEVVEYASIPFVSMVFTYLHIWLALHVSRPALVAVPPLGRAAVSLRTPWVPLKRRALASQMTFYPLEFIGIWKVRVAAAVVATTRAV